MNSEVNQARCGKGVGTVIELNDFVFRPGEMAACFKKEKPAGYKGNITFDDKPGRDIIRQARNFISEYNDSQFFRGSAPSPVMRASSTK